MALAYTVRERLLHHLVNTVSSFIGKEVKVVSYFSAEYLPGPHLGNNLVNLGIYDEVKQAVAEFDGSLMDLLDQEEEPGLGNGGLGRLAACLPRLPGDACASPPSATGCATSSASSTRRSGTAGRWRSPTSGWNTTTPGRSAPPRNQARSEVWRPHRNLHRRPGGKYQVRWVPERVVKGVAYDTPILGYRVNNCNIMRLWKAEAVESFDFQAFDKGDYYDAVNEKVVSENITKVLYPNDGPLVGKKLQAVQQYFFCSCALQDMIRMHLELHSDLKGFHDAWAVQLNDTHPAVAVAELMRLLVDEHRMDWDQAWDITKKTMAYTNHTLLPEALEKWPLPLFAGVLAPAPGDHLRAQPPLPGRGAPEVAPRRRPHRAALPHR